MNKLRIFNLLVVFALAMNTVIAQPGGPNGERPKIGTLTGQVKNADSKKPIAYAKIFLLSARDSSVVTGGLADSLGNFIIEEIMVGPYIAKISSFGYSALFVDSLFFHPKSPRKDLGAIYMVRNDTLAGVDVVFERTEVEAQIDKKVFNVDKQLTSQGGTAVDVLQNIPSVTVDMDGNISLRGSANVTILIDGRPSSITGGGRQGALTSIPASSIESIEIITNPSAKYDPDGMSGIINIILKKNKLKGFNGNIDLSLENGIHPDSLNAFPKLLGFGYNTSFNLAYRNKFFNVYGGFSSNWYEGYRNYDQINETFYSSGYNRIEQHRTGTHLRQGNLVKAGSDFYINSKNTLGFSFNGNIGREERTGDMFYYEADSVANYNVWQRLSDDPGTRNGFDASLYYTKKFNESDHKLDFNGQYSKGGNTTEGDYLQNDYNPTDLTILTPNTLDQYVRTIDGHAFTTLQLDYYQPLKRIIIKDDSTKVTRLGKFEAGLKSTIREVNQDYYQETFSIADVDRNNKFDFTEQVHAAYAIFGQDFEKFKYQIGLRAEAVFITSEVDKDTNLYTNNYQSLYPSLHLVRPLKENSELTLSYSRRVNRPHLHALNPFSNYTDPLNLQVGNPKLSPEYINSIELGYGLYGKKVTVTSSVYYRFMTDMIQRVRSIDTNGVATTTWSNIDDAQFYGLELMSIIKATKWWRIMASFNFSQTYINSTSGESALNNSGYSWSTNLMQTFTFNKGLSAQMTGFYRSPMILTQGLSQPMYSMDVAIRKTFLKDKMYANFKVSDIFNTRQFAFETSQEGVFESYGKFKHQSRRFTLTIGYVFGNQDADKRRKGREGMGSEGGGEMGP